MCEMHRHMGFYTVCFLCQRNVTELVVVWWALAGVTALIDEWARPPFEWQETQAMSCCAGIQTPLMAERHRASVHSGGKTMVVRGPVTGLNYRFSGTDRSALLDPRDAVALTRMRLFHIQGIVEIAVP